MFPLLKALDSLHLERAGEAAMFAECSTLLLKPNGRKKLFEIARAEVTPILQGQKEFEKGFIMISLEANEATLITVWNKPRQTRTRVAMFEALAALSPITDTPGSIREFRITEPVLMELEALTPKPIAAKARSNVRIYCVSGRTFNRVRRLGDPTAGARPS